MMCPCDGCPWDHGEVEIVDCIAVHAYDIELRTPIGCVVPELLPPLVDDEGEL